MNLRASMFWSYLNQYGAMAIQFVSSIILARLLMPEEIGIFSVAISFVALGQMLRDFGIGEYLIQEKDISQEKIRTGFTLSLLLSWTLGIVLLLLTKPISDFYGQPGLEKILPLIAFNFFLIPFGAITLALLRKEMRFDLIMRIQLLSSLVQPVVSILLAYHDFSYMSLAWGSVAGTATSVLMSQFYRRDRLSFSLTLSNWRSVVGYGSYNTITNLSSSLGTSAPDLIIGKVLDMHYVGIFNRGLGLLNMVRNLVIGGIKPILLPHFSKKHLEGDEVLSTSFLDMTDVLLFIFWPILGYIAIFSQEIILILFGENWIEASPVLAVLCIGSIFGTTIAFSPELFKASGNIKILTYISSSFSIIRVIFVLAGSMIGFIWIPYLWAFVS
ncbi:MAG TPA: lipopolysaccharide biosynthesis protein, partial [Sedimenticola thiotaurini]|nr:lipopolysaccharide biosynthesis protein [Sedimenticola thiotaurini]